MTSEIDEIIAWCEAEAHPEREPSEFDHLPGDRKRILIEMMHELRSSIGCAMTYHDDLIRICTERAILLGYIKSIGHAEKANEFLESVKIDLSTAVP
jgi:hypothetical protein